MWSGDFRAAFSRRRHPWLSSGGSLILLSPTSLPRRFWLSLVWFVRSLRAIFVPTLARLNLEVHPLALVLGGSSTVPVLSGGLPRRIICWRATPLRRQWLALVLSCGIRVRFRLGVVVGPGFRCCGCRCSLCFFLVHNEFAVVTFQASSHSPSVRAGAVRLLVPKGVAFRAPGGPAFSANVPGSAAPEAQWGSPRHRDERRAGA